MYPLIRNTTHGNKNAELINSILETGIRVYERFDFKYIPYLLLLLVMQVQVLQIIRVS